MRTTIDPAGRLVVPKPLRDALHLHEGGEVELEVHDGVIEVRVASAPVRIAEMDEGPVLVPVEAVPTMGSDVVDEVLDQIRR